LLDILRVPAQKRGDTAAFVKKKNVQHIGKSIQQQSPLNKEIEQSLQKKIIKLIKKRIKVSGSIQGWSKSEVTGQEARMN